MTQQQKTLLGVGAIAVVGYLVYQNYNKKSFMPTRPTRVFANAVGSRPRTEKEIVPQCKCIPGATLTQPDGTTLYECQGGKGRFTKKCGDKLIKASGFFEF